MLKDGSMLRYFVAGVAVAAFLALPAAAAAGPVVVSHGRQVEIAVVLDRGTGVGAPLTPSIVNAIQMATQLFHPIRGFRVQLEPYDAPCGDDEAVAPNASVAQTVVANPQIVAVIGHECSYSFSGGAELDDNGVCLTPTRPNALAIYESAGIPTIDGSTTSPCLPADGLTVFNRTAAADPGFDTWYASVKALPSDKLWTALYTLEFGAPPGDYADLYFDATTLLLERIFQVSRVSASSLVIDRAVLAEAIRNTTDFSGVTGSITLDPATGNRAIA
jgi:ABC-type branched-subunit amino acid transport system substrate-binding protein